MYHVYIKEKTQSLIETKTLLADYKDIDDAYARVDEELAENPDFKYSIEETTGHVDNYGELISDIIEEN